MHRLFVAIRPPAPVRACLTALMGGVEGARWQDDDQLHLTLRFIGEVDRHVAEDVAAVLGAVRHPRFAVTLEGIGQFDHRGRTTSLWMGATPPEPLAALHRKVDQALVRIRLEPERRAFVPHVTLARFGRDAGPLDAVMASSAVAGGASFTVEDFRLYESALRRDGASYDVVERYRLE